MQNFDYNRAKTENLKINQDPLFEGPVIFFTCIIAKRASVILKN